MNYLGAMTQEHMTNQHAEAQLAEVLGKDMAKAIMQMRAAANGELKMSIGKTSFDNPQWDMPIRKPGDNEVRLGFLEENQQHSSKGQKGYFATEFRLTPQKDQLQTGLVIYSLVREGDQWKSCREIQSWKGSEALSRWQRAYEFLVTTGRQKRRENLVPQNEALQVFQGLVPQG